MEDRRIELDYVFDRLGEAQLVQVYRLLVPERRRLTGREGDSDDDSGDLRAAYIPHISKSLIRDFVIEFFER